MKTMRAAPIALFLLGTGCDFFLGSNDPWPVTPIDSDAGEASTVETNPVGEACPTDNLGHTPHTHIANLKFKGYKANGTSPIAAQGDLVPISLCDFYNPTGKNGNYKLIHIAGASRWCGPCSHEASDISGYDYQAGQRTGPGIAADLAPLGVVFFQVLFEGEAGGSPATNIDLQLWATSHQSNFTSVIDPGPTALREFLDGKTLPWNADINARTMEILGVTIGLDVSLEDTLKKTVSSL